MHKLVFNDKNGFFNGFFLLNRRNYIRTFNNQLLTTKTFLHRYKTHLADFFEPSPFSAMFCFFLEAPKCVLLLKIVRV